MKTKIGLGFVMCCALFAMTGCMTASRVVHEGERVETVAGFSQDDLDYTIDVAVESLRKVSKRYQVQGGGRRIVNVKNVLNDTMERGHNAEALAENLGQALRERLTNDGAFIVYNESVARQARSEGVFVGKYEFILKGSLRQRNMRKDNGDFYKEFSLNLSLVGAAGNPDMAGLEVWQKRIPLRKEVDRTRIMN